MMKRIQEVIVVEGRHDTEKLRKYFDCDTIETGGSSLGRDVLERIEAAQKTRGVIIFTDPDSSGNRIRNTVNRKIPGCKNAFVDRENAHTTKKVGVEHANEETLTAALEHLVTYREHPEKQITVQEFYELGLTGGTDSAALRDKVGSIFHIGSGSAKTVLHRLNCLNITYEQLKEAVNK
jgi:ribonuclease M5